MNWVLWAILAGLAAVIPLMDDPEPGDFQLWAGFQLLVQPIIALAIVVGAVFT